MPRLLPLLAALLALPTSAQIVVTSAADVAAEDGACTLREAIVASNTDAASGTTAGECAAGSGADVVTFALPPGSVVTLTADLPTVTQSWTLDGPTGRAGGVVIDGAGAHRIFELDSNNGQQTHTLRGLTIRHGLAEAGGGILVGTGDHCVFEDLAVVDNVATNGGGGIFTGREGTCTMDRLYVAGNVAEGPSGAGGIRISFGTTATIRNSTIADNAAPAAGAGGILVMYSVPPAGAFTLEQSTLSGNVAADNGGGIAQSGTQGTSVIRASTIVGNSVTAEFGAGGGASFNGDVTFESTIVAGNSSVRGVQWNDLSLGTNRTTSNGGNVIGINGLFGSDFPPGQPNANGDLVGTTAAPFAPELGDLADNGGPMPTHRPLDGSPVLDAGVCTGAATDQRGSQREVDEPDASNGNGDACDAGAVEGTAFFIATDPPATATGPRLGVPAPNPARHAASVRFALDAPAHTRLSVVDLLGREVLAPHTAARPAGTHTVQVDVAALAPGAYVLRLQTEAGVQTRLLTVVR